jgi:type IV pilus assembly protein PilW
MNYPGAIPHRGKIVQGVTMIELLVSMLLGLLLSAAMVSLYITAKQHYFYAVQTARMQENGRYALRLLSRELEMAGFLGGVLAPEDVPVASVGRDCSFQNWALDVSQPLQLVNDHAGDALPLFLNLEPITCLENAAIKNDTDLIAIKRTAGEASLRRGIPADRLAVSSRLVWYLRLIDGRSPEWEKLRPSQLASLGEENPGRSYWEAISKIIFVRKYSDAGDLGRDVPTLCMATLAGDGMTTRCLVEGVENMQLEFGVDTDSDGIPNQYKSAPSAAELRNAVTAKVFLLMRSINPLADHDDRKTYALGEKTVAAQHDRYIRRVFSSTILLRNRIERIY